MLKHRPVVLVFGICLLIIAGFVSSPLASAAQFSADLKIVKSGKITTGKLYVHGELYRMELLEDNKSIVVIVDDKTELTRVLVPPKKIYLQMGNNDIRSAMNNPFVSYQISRAEYGSEDIDKEIVNGYQCTKRLTKSFGKDFLTAWISDKLGFPIKIVNHLRKGYFTELTHIKIGPQDAHLFRPPAGYAKMDHMPVEPPFWSADVPNAPVLSIPFEKTLSAGKIVKVALKKGYKISVQGENLLDGRTSVTAVAFKDGNPVSQPSMSTFNLSRRGQRLTITPQETIEQADDIVIRVGKGEARIKAVEETASQKTRRNDVAEGQVMAQKTEQSTAGAGSSSGGNSPVTVMFVLDASGSMWGQISGKPKIKIAKTVLSDLIGAIPDNFRTGLMVYGHRRKGDCKDIEIVVPVGSHNSAAMKAKMQAISPKGKTPLSSSIKQAAKALRYTEERATVVLISDGLETCDMAPCELAAELAKSGVDFTVHVIGFDISKDEQEQLRCLADKTGGLFLAAADAVSLRDALSKTVDEIKEPPRPVVDKPGTAVLKGPDSVPVGSDFMVQWKGPDSRGDLVAVTKKGEHGTRYKDYAYTKRGNPAHLTAPGVVGAYELRYVYGNGGKVIGKTNLKVTPVPAEVQVPSEASVAAEFDVIWQGPNYRGDYIAIAKSGTTPNNRIYYTYTRKGSPLKLMAPSEPGPYEVRYILGKSRQVLTKTAIEIKAASASIQTPAFADVAHEFEVSWKGPDNESDYIAIATVGSSPNSRIHYTSTKKGSPLYLLAPSDPGTYEVRYILGRGHKLLASSPIEIKAVGASLQAPTSAAMASQVDITWQGPDNESDYIAFVRPGDGANRRLKYTATKHGSPLKVRAPSDPGKYEVIYIMAEGKKVLARIPIEIKPVSAKIDPPATAGVNTKIEVPWQGPGYESDLITLARPEQNPGSRVTYRYTLKGNPAIIRTPKKPGTYEVRYILGEGRKILDKKMITIK